MTALSPHTSPHRSPVHRSKLNNHTWSPLPSLPPLSARLQDNLYWLGLLTHLQAPCVPLKSLDCLRDLRDMYEAASVEDVYDAYAQVGVLLCTAAVLLPRQGTAVYCCTASVPETAAMHLRRIDCGAFCALLDLGCCNIPILQ